MGDKGPTLALILQGSQGRGIRQSPEERGWFLLLLSGMGEITVALQERVSQKVGFASCSQQPLFV